MTVGAADGVRGLADIAAAARGAIAARAAEIDLLNVFPVADGDTGTNLAATVAALERAVAETAELPAEDRAARVTRAALMGARGNSGMILSQMVRGAAEALGAAAGGVDGAAVAAALRAASDRAQAAVRRPVEGTMLTVMRRAAEAAGAAAGAPAGEVLDIAARAAAEAVEETPAQLDVLRQAGVVDAGGVGVAVLLDGIAAAVAGRAVASGGAPAVPAATEHAPSRHRWCTTFLVEGEALDAERLEAGLADLGDSLLVMGDSRQVKVHIHTDAPEAAAARAGGWGAVAGLQAEDMRRQEAERQRRLAPAPPPSACALVVVADGAGVRELAEGLGARAVAPEADLGEVLAEAGDAVVVADGSAAARRAAARAAGRPVVDAGSAPALLACLVAFDGDGDARGNAARMEAAAAEVGVVEIDAAGVAELRAELGRRLGDLLSEGPHLVTLVLGEGAPVSPQAAEGWVREAAAARPGGAEVEVEAHLGGQRAPVLAVGVE